MQTLLSVKLPDRSECSGVSFFRSHPSGFCPPENRLPALSSHLQNTEKIFFFRNHFSQSVFEHSSPQSARPSSFGRICAFTAQTAGKHSVCGNPCPSQSDFQRSDAVIVQPAEPLRTPSWQAISNVPPAETIYKHILIKNLYSRTVFFSILISSNNYKFFILLLFACIF